MFSKFIMTAVGIAIFIVSDIWQNIGFNSIIYLAALSGINEELYEAAKIDGAGRFRQMLSVTLRTLEEDGYLTRQVYPEVPPRVEYSLTSRAQSLLACIDPLVAWADANMADILNDRKTARGER